MADPDAPLARSYGEYGLYGAREFVVKFFPPLFTGEWKVPKAVSCQGTPPAVRSRGGRLAPREAHHKEALVLRAPLSDQLGAHAVLRLHLRS